MPALGVARQWFQFSFTQTDNEPRFFSFLTTWIAFNALYSSGKGAELKRVQDFLRDHLSDAHKTLLDTHDDYQRAIAYFCEDRIRNVRKGGVLVEISEPGDVGKVGEVLYVIRCNLVHGDKTPDSWRDQIVVNNAMVILGNLLQHYLGFHPA